MLTVKFLKYGPADTDQPSYTESVVLRPADVVFVECSDVHGRQVVGVQHPKTGEIDRYTIGTNRSDVMFNVAYVMNDAGKTVETIR